MTTITILVDDRDPFADDDHCAAKLEGNGTSDHWRAAIRGAMTLAGYQPETIEDVLEPPQTFEVCHSAIPETQLIVRTLTQEQSDALTMLKEEANYLKSRLERHGLTTHALDAVLAQCERAGL